MEPSIHSIEFSKPFTGRDLFLGSNILPAPEHHGVVNRLDKELDTSGVSEKLRELNNSLKGDKILVLLPTANEQKVKVLKHFFPDFLETLMFEILPGINSKVGEQPYNSAGPRGAVNRVIESLKALVSGSTDLGPASKYCEDNNIGKIMVASIENYIQGTPSEARSTPRYSLVLQVETPQALCSEISGFVNPTLRAPIDYGFGVLYDVITGKLIFAHTRGVPVPSPKAKDGSILDLVALAMSKGFVDHNGEYGAQTVGKVIKALVEPTSGMVNSDDRKPYKIDANWHADVTGGSPDRYSLLYEAAADICERGCEEGMFDI